MTPSGEGGGHYATREDVREANRDVVAQVREGFDGLHSRLDKFDERAQHLSEQVSRHDERLRVVETKPTGASGATPVDWKWMSGIIAVVAGAVMGLIQGAAKVYAMIAGTPAK